MQRLLASAQKLAEPGVAVGKQTYPDYSGIAAPAHENVEKDRVHLMVSEISSLCSVAHFRPARPMRCSENRLHVKASS